MSIARFGFLGLLVTAISMMPSFHVCLLPSASLPPLSFDKDGLWEETLQQAKDTGIDYLPLVRSARKGDAKSLNQLFAMRVDAAGALGHGIVLLHVLQARGDHAFAEAILRRPRGERHLLRELLKCGLDYGAGLDQKNLPDLFPESFRATQDPS